MERPGLPAKVKDFAREKKIEGFTAEEIEHLIGKNDDLGMYSGDRIEDYLSQESTKERISLERSIQEKQAEVSREDLIRELAEQKDYIVEQRKRLKGSNDEVSDQQTKNLLKAIRQLGELIDVLENKDGGNSNTVNINKLEQNVNIAQSIEYMPAEDKKDIIDRLEDDPDIKDYAIIKKQDEREVAQT